MHYSLAYAYQSKIDDGRYFGSPDEALDYDLARVEAMIGLSPLNIDVDGAKAVHFLSQYLRDRETEAFVATRERVQARLATIGTEIV